MKIKECTKCGIKKSLDKFYNNKKLISGKHSRCKQCCSEDSMEWGKNNPKRKAKSIKRWQKKYPLRAWAANVLGQKRYCGYDVQITIYELEKLAKEIKNCCYCDQFLIYRNKGGKHANSASFDRINNSKIVLKNNTQIICDKCNVTKSNRTHDEFIKYCKKISKRFE